MRTGMRKLAPVVVAFALAAPARAQDAHYWSQQYGTRSELLAGSVVGSPQDLSTTFYNPGGLAQLETESFLLSATAFEYQRLSTRDPTGAFDGVTNDRLGTAPSLFTGLFPRDWVRGTLAYSFLTRHRFDLRINSWRVDDVPLPGGERTGGNLFVDQRLSEDWGGLTWSEPFGDVGVGVSLYGAYRSQRGRTEILSQPIPTGSAGPTFSLVDDYSYWHFRLLAKLGLYWDGDAASVGVTFTTPGLGLFGNGRAAYHRNIDPDTLPVSTQVALRHMDPRNVTLEPEYYGEIDRERYASRKPLLWLWEMFDRSALGENVDLGVRFRRVLANHVFASCGRNFKAFTHVRVSYGYNLHVGDNVVVHRHVLLDDRGGIDIGDGASISDFANVYSHSHNIVDGRIVYLPKTVIGSGARITYHATVLAGTRVGEDSMVGAGSILTKDTEPHWVYVGVPARRAKEKPAEERAAKAPRTQDPLADS